MLLTNYKIKKLCGKYDIENIYQILRKLSK